MTTSINIATRAFTRARGSLFLLTCMAALVACPASQVGDTTEIGESSGAGSSGTAAAGSTVVDTGEPEPTGGSTATEPAATDTGSMGSTDTTAMETGSTETGAADCEPSWAVPDVTAEALEKHDLAWVGCEFTACGPADQPGPGEASLLCAPISIAEVPLTYLGFMHPNESGAFTTEDVISEFNIPWIDGSRHIYRYDDSVYILTEGDGAVEQLEVFYTARALESLRSLYPSAYQQLVSEQSMLPAEPPLDGFGWKNRVRSFVVSFDTSPFSVVAGVTVLDAAPVMNMRTNLSEYSNAAVVSIDRETILGGSDVVGSRPIYNAASDDENFLRYMREGVAEAIVHEFVRLRVDRRNSVDADMNELYNRRVIQGACAQFELEEALVASTSLLLFRAAGGMSDTYLDYYDVVLDANLAVIKQCMEYEIWSEQFLLPSGVDERYDLRLFALE